MGSKYNAKPCELDGIRFDSQAERNRYSILKQLELAGEIRALTVHPRYCLQTAYKDANGKTVKAIYYEADFEYAEQGEDGQWRMVVEDVKGVQTPVFKLKAKIFRKLYGCELRIEAA